MRCEVCGQRIHGVPQRVNIEGAKLMVCSACAQFGTPCPVESKPKMVKKTGSIHINQPLLAPLPVKASVDVDSSLEIVENFGTIIKQGRERLGLTHEELGKKINEKVSLLKKIEAEKMVPNHKLAVRLEHALKIKLLVPISEPKIPREALTSSIKKQKLTLGDLLSIEKKENKTLEEQQERKQS
jgi:putative transcription factor